MASVTKHIVITGASSGLGAAAAKTLAIAGHRIFITGRNEDKLKTVVKDIEAHGGVAGYGVGDVADEKDTERVFNQALKSLDGKIDVFFGNAGIGRPGLLEEKSPKDFDDIFGANVKGIFLWLRLVLPIMKAQKAGQIIVTSSVLGLYVAGKASLYAATKWALQGLIGSLRKELEGTGVKAATINPASIATEWWDEEVRGGYDPQVLAARGLKKDTMLSTEDVVSAVVMLINQSPTCDIDKIVLGNSVQAS